MSWVLTIFVAILTLSHLSEASHHRRKLPSAVVVGTVYCDTCFQENLAKTSHFISGASVAVECKYGSNPKPIFQQEVKTDNHGEFKVHLPFAISKHVKNIKGCSVKLISSSEPYCAVASTATSSSLHLKSRKEGTHIFSAGFFTFKPQKQPTLCNQKPSIQNSRDLSSKKASLHSNPDFTFPPQLQDLPAPGLVPGLPNLPPLPQLPPLPPLPGVPNFPPTFQGKQTAETKTTQSPTTPNTYQKEARRDTFFPPIFPPLIPNPFQPPPLIPNPFQPPPLIPNPFQPPPAPIIPNPFQPPPAPIIPNPFQPPPAAPSPIFPFPPIPGLTPSPPPPPPTFHFPSFPFPPLFPPSPPKTPPKHSSPSP